MSSPAQIAANQANAQKSTGPCTEEGKAASSRNARTHCLTTRDVVLKESEREEFDELCQGIWDEVRPQSALEELFCRNLIHAAWTQVRARRAEVSMATIKPGLDPLVYTNADGQLRNIDLYGRRADSRLNRALAELRILKAVEKTKPISTARTSSLSNAA